ncbi:MAG: hypothetical protein R3263_09060, partial [Myxococcota bacterium]|nr:hypothetical protein [Myxococcota bacterium]
GDVDAALTYRVADRNLQAAGAEELPHRLQWTGAGRLRGGAQGEDWALVADGGVILDREGESSPTGRSLELTDFLVTGEKDALTVQAGHHAPAPDTLILEGFHRRGVSAQLAGEPGGVPTGLTAFALRTEPLAGFREGLGVRDADHRTYGAAWEARPIAREDVRLDVGALYLRGRGGEGGSAVVGDDLVTEDRLESGTAWSVFADGAAWDRRLRLRGEYARTHFDPDGPGPDASRRDAGWSVLGEVRPFRSLVLAGRPLAMSLSAEQRELGADFRSIANPGAPRDQRSLDLRWRGDWAGLQTSLGFYRARDDVDEDPLQAGYRADRFDAELAYAFPWLARRPEAERWLGAPYLSVRWSRDRLKPIDRPEAPKRVVVPGVGLVELPPPLLFDQLTRVTVVSLGSSYRRLGWNASHMVVRLDDQVLGDDQRTDSSSLDVSWRFDAGATLTARLQRDRVKALATGFQTTSWLGGVGAWAPLYASLADASLQLDVQRSRSSDSAVDRTTATLPAGLHWHALRPVNRRPGLDVSLLGTWQREEDDVRRDVTDRLQVMLQLRLVWPVRWGGVPCAGRGCR